MGLKVEGINNFISVDETSKLVKSGGVSYEIVNKKGRLVLGDLSIDRVVTGDTAYYPSGLIGEGDFVEL